MKLSYFLLDIYSLFRIVSHRFLKTGLDVSCVPFSEIPGNIAITTRPLEKSKLSLSNLWEATIPSEEFFVDPISQCCQPEFISRKSKGRWSIKPSLDIESQITVFEQDSHRVASNGLPYEQSEYIATLSRLIIGNSMIAGIPDGEARVMAIINRLSHSLSLQCEYRYFSYNNHLLNNLRALTWAHYLNEESEKFERSSGLYFYYLDKLLDDSGWLTEGSSSYHVLVTVWTLEMVHILHPDSRQHVFVTLYKMIEHCDVFITEANKLIIKGDICPDMTTDMIIRDFNVLVANFRDKSDNRGSNLISQSSEYISLSRDKKKVVCSILPSERGQRPHHGHMDSRHLDYVIGGIPLIINAGRHCYSGICELQAFQRSAACHNGAFSFEKFLPRLRSEGYWLPSFLNGKDEIRIYSDSCFLIADASNGAKRLATSRVINFNTEGALEVTDSFDKPVRGKKPVSFLYIFDPAFKLSKFCEQSISYASDQISGTIDIEGKLDKLIITVDEIVSKNYGHIEKAFVVELVINPMREQKIKLLIH